MCGAVETQDITRADVRHLEGEAKGVAASEEIGSSVEMCSYVVCWLHLQERKECSDRGCERR